MSTQELENLVAMLRARPTVENPPVEEMRARFNKLGEMLAAPAHAQCETADAAGVAAQWIAGSNAKANTAILYLHGGGYVIGSIDTHRNLAYNLSYAAGARVLAIDYRLAPEAPFPAAVDDAVSAYHWLLDEGIDPTNVVLAGDSAGGGLVVAALVSLRDQGVALPAAGICISPWVDMEALGESMQSKAELDPMVQKAAIERFAAMYLNGADARSPLAAPIYADLTGLPPLLIQVGTAETLYDDATRLAQKARTDGVDVTLEESENMIHVWHLFAPLLSEGKEATERAGAFAKKHLG